MEKNLYEKFISICVKCKDIDSIRYYIDLLCSAYQREIDIRDKLIEELTYTVDRLLGRI